LHAEAREANVHARAGPNLIYIPRRDLSFHDELIALRDDQHELLAALHNTTHRVDRKVMHDARLRGAKVDTAELILCRDLPLGELGALGLNFAELLDDFGTALLKVAEVQLRLGNFPLVSATDATS